MDFKINKNEINKFARELQKEISKIKIPIEGEIDMSFKPLSPQCEELLYTLLNSKDPSEIAIKMFDNLRGSEEFTLRSRFKALEEQKYIQCSWSPTFPHYILINKDNCENYESNKKDYEQLSRGIINNNYNAETQQINNAYDNSTINANQNINPKLDELKEIIKQINEEIPENINEEDREQLSTSLEIIENQFPDIDNPAKGDMAKKTIKMALNSIPKVVSTLTGIVSLIKFFQ
ncbi:MAG: hypothetical protein LBM93_01980 [Oscillospiraceae bacterium]|jgi:hypothetical protein|nr:hypothetical protein [Oscillospiraceae bacterium]